MPETPSKNKSRIPLNNELQQYVQNGYVHLSAALDDEWVAMWRKTIIDAAMCRPNVSQGDEYIAVFEPDTVEQELSHILCSTHLARIAASFLGSTQVRIFAAAAYLKPPGGSASFWHQDLWFFPIADAPLITLWLPLSAIDDQQAPLLFARQSHASNYIDWTEENAPTHWPIDRQSPMALGDVTVHNGWTLHGSEANTSKQPREALGIVYIREGTRFATRTELQSNDTRWKRMEHYLNDPAYVEGAVINGPRCPLVNIN